MVNSAENARRKAMGKAAVRVSLLMKQKSI